MNATSLQTTENKSLWRNPFGIALVVYYLVIASLVATGESQSIRMYG